MSKPIRAMRGSVLLAVANVPCTGLPSPSQPPVERGKISYHALNRIISFFPAENRPALFLDLSVALRAIISQRLVRTKTGERLPAAEIMLNTKLVADLIEQSDFSGVREAMEKSMAEGSQTFEEDLARLMVEAMPAKLADLFASFGILTE